MKIPDHIKKKMHRLAKLSQQAYALSREIDNYFVKNGYDIEKLRSGSGVSLEELEYGNDITDEFCEFVENDNLEKI